MRELTERFAVQIMAVCFRNNLRLESCKPCQGVAAWEF
jgi:hypothetical protein